MAQEVRVLKALNHSNYAIVDWAENGAFRYVACWSPWVVETDEEGNSTERRPNDEDVGKTVKMYWGQGHYFQTVEDAFLHGVVKEIGTLEEHIRWLEDSI